MNRIIITTFVTLLSANVIAQECTERGGFRYDDVSIATKFEYSGETGSLGKSVYFICRINKPIPQGSALIFSFNDGAYVKTIDNYSISSFTSPNLTFVHNGNKDLAKAAVRSANNHSGKYSYECQYYFCV